MPLPDPAMVTGPLGERLQVPTPQHPVDGQVTHPSVVYVEGGFGGYEYWLGITPYPDGDDEHEEPCVLCSHDGVTWIVPPGGTNPLDDQPGSPGAFNSDIDLTLVGSTMYVVWRTYDPAAVGAEETLYVRTTVDGVTWTPKAAFYVQSSATRRLLSPAMMFEGGAWHFWAVNLTGSPNTLVRVQGGANLTDAWADPVVCEVAPIAAGREPWHVEVIQSDGGYVGLLTDSTLDDPGADGEIMFMTSVDGLTWTTGGRSVVPQVMTGGHQYLYRASLVPETIGSVLGWRMWYSAWWIDTNPVWYLYRTWATAGQTTAPPVTVADIAAIVSGSFEARVEARVCTTYQTGPDPEGTEIPVEGGDVSYDATADVWSTMSMRTPGVSEVDGTSMFPRHASDLLAPYGNEVFIRWGIDTGSEILWVPMGYYRIDSTDQAGSSEGDIDLGGSDRMQGVIDARLIEPRQYQSTDTVAAVVFDLVLDVYPNAIVLWDDDSEQLPIGRSYVVKEDRYAALKDIARTRGKIVYWDSEGVLRFETEPDPDVIAWEIHAGANGVLVTSDRSVSRTGMYNGVVARGEGTTEDPASGIAVDAGALSPTRWGSRFGMVPRFYTSPLILTDEQAQRAAAAMLRRVLGMPYSASFGTVPNPALRPRQAVRVAQRDGNRERHLVEKLRVPLDVKGAMTGSTREQTLAHVGTLG